MAPTDDLTANPADNPADVRARDGRGQNRPGQDGPARDGSGPDRREQDRSGQGARPRGTRARDGSRARAEGSADAGPPAWLRCPGCAQLIYHKHFRRTLGVCPGCGRHTRLSAPERLDQLLDAGSATPLEAPPHVHDPLGFQDLRPYPERLAEARAGTGLHEAVLGARGTVLGQPLVTAVMDFRFLGGSLGSGAGALITAAARTSLAERVPLLLVTASGGARMQEGALSLMQMAKTSQALGELDEAGVLTLSLVTDPTYGGVAASFASLPDVILAEPGARLGFAGPRVIEQTTGQQLPEGFQTAEFLLDHGMVDDVVPRSALRPALARLLAAGPGGGPRETALSPAPPSSSPVLRDPEEVPVREPVRAVRLARHPERPTVLDYADRLLEDFHELHGDRLAEDCPAVTGGPGSLAGRPVMLIGHHKGGPALAQRKRHRFGMATPAGYRKAARLMRMAAKLGLPVVTLIDTPGASPGADCEKGGQAVAIAENLRLMSRLPVPVVAVVTGEGGSGGALALGVADRVLVSVNGIYSVISPEGCAAILWKEPEAAPAAAAALRLDARELLRLGIVDGVVPEPEGGAHRDHGAAAARLGTALHEALAELAGLPSERLLRERRDRFHRFGAVAAPLTEPGRGTP
ncbi:acetyl-CoA carboxylase, carboxyltransferase subunit beta [Streptomyces sp. NA04227]|uniref:acetyl-CoA carboxylase, carboxyltransferase subunit beta n=1 Tax=Streptomyces sp. NA04227 TaxID=2742136 RepID=UPI001590F85C|nr:acetyl-CoA carboxylase, carboxyltransferase subunit beta [Streptomyces sp. NA04227]QKW05055.1 acetyl-CoA carboxylase, carboxyltransferase subunit beta [Streptomyces sp. NA04227]